MNTLLYPILLSVVCLLSRPTIAQGQLIMVTKDLTGVQGNRYDAAVGGDIANATAQLFRVVGDAYLPLTPTTRFNSSGEIGALQAAVVTVPGVPPGQSAELALAAYIGPSYDLASVKTPFSKPFTTTPLSIVPSPCEFCAITDLSGIEVNSAGLIVDAEDQPLILHVPEPPAFALFGIGFGTLLSRRRRISKRRINHRDAKPSKVQTA